MHADLVVMFKVMVLLVVPLLLIRIITLLLVHSASRDVSKAPLVEVDHILVPHFKMLLIIISQLE
jgi:hypothetical protein